MKVLIVDDHRDARDALAHFVTELGHDIVCAEDGREALDKITASRPDLIISDLRMPGMDGMALLAALEAFDDPPPLALITAYADANFAVEALRCGACDYLRKPIDIREIHQLIERIDCALPKPALPATNEPLPGTDGVVIAGPAFASVVALADRLHRFSDLSALIEGETGTGKELIARRIHHGGDRDCGKPFVALNCAAIPTGLFEAELFGYVSGAFTGAASGGSPGRIAQAGDGTLFLDEVGEMPLDQQAKLLRVLEERAYFPVGGSKQQRLSARVVCACNSDLYDAVLKGRFREDLLYRLKVGFVRIPPLRERPEEILPIARAMIASIRKSRGAGFTAIDPQACDMLRQGAWPGNVRQLRHVLERATIERLPSDTVLGPAALRSAIDERSQSEPRVSSVTPAPALSGPAQLSVAPPKMLSMPPERFDLDAWHRAMIASALVHCDRSPVKTARYLGISRKVLYTLRKRYGLMDAG
jgi:DNA-binding NtrC family response regulator